MEEQKNNGKVVNMGVDHAQKESKEKLSYEELNNAAIQLSKENTYLRQHLQDATAELRMINRLDYLLKVVALSFKNTDNTYSFSPSFVQQCIEDIEKIMTPPEEPGEPANNKN